MHKVSLQTANVVPEKASTACVADHDPITRRFGVAHHFCLLPVTGKAVATAGEIQCCESEGALS